MLLRSIIKQTFNCLLNLKNKQWFTQKHIFQAMMYPYPRLDLCQKIKFYQSCLFYPAKPRIPWKSFTTDDKRLSMSRR